MADAVGNVFFFITPIGEPGSAERKRADSLQNYILATAIDGIAEIVRADEIAEPGSITAQIFSYVVETKYAVADLHGFNPNVMYELGVRHSFNLPTILRIDYDQKMPFDLFSERAIQIDLSDLSSHETLSMNIRKFILSIDNGIKYTSPVLANTKLKSEIAEKTIATISQLIDSVDALEFSVEDISSNIDTLNYNIDSVNDDIGDKLSLLFKLVNKKIKKSD